MKLPDGVLSMAVRGPDWSEWVDRLPRLRADLMEEWGLTPDGWMMHGFCSLVVPAVDAEGQRVVLKLTVDSDVESQHEGLALQAWGGEGAVRLLRADPHRRALLLERLDPTDLRDVWDLEACEIVAGLWSSLHRPALPQLVPLSQYVGRWVDELVAESPAAVPRRMIEQAASVARDLLAVSDAEPRLLHGDLHYYNVLSSDRGWLAIDPKPMAGDPHYEVAPMLWNRTEELRGDFRDGVRRRFHALVDAGGLDEDRARDWVVVREVLNAHWAAEVDDQEAVTVALSIAKAVQD
jgi:streptomycin 6-kinase